MPDRIEIPMKAGNYKKKDLLNAIYKLKTQPKKEYITTFEGMKFYFVEREFLKEMKLDRFWGLHPLYFDSLFIPKDEIWINEKIKNLPNKVYETIFHEILEFKLMEALLSIAKINYVKAYILIHPIAKKLEDKKEHIDLIKNQLKGKFPNYQELDKSNLLDKLKSFFT
jgi:hypothetical protein